MVKKHKVETDARTAQDRKKHGTSGVVLPGDGVAHDNTTHKYKAPKTQGEMRRMHPPARSFVDEKLMPKKCKKHTHNTHYDDRITHPPTPIH